MYRYFIEVAYNGARYSGFQIQQNANTIQAELEKALEIFYHHPLVLTGSSRTDAGVHARQNFFHFDVDNRIDDPVRDGYHLNAILPEDIVVNEIRGVKSDAHCRFDAISREYGYYIYRKKNPFIHATAFFFPYKVDVNGMNMAAEALMQYRDFTSFSKRKTQVKNFICDIKRCRWEVEDELLVLRVEANRFLRGMVKGMVGTMLQVGRNKIGIEEFGNIIGQRDCTLADFSVPSHGLFLEKVRYDWLGLMP